MLNYIAVVVELKGLTLSLVLRLDLVDILWEPLEEYLSDTGRYSQFLIPTENAHHTSQLRRYWSCTEADISVWEINTSDVSETEWYGEFGTAVPIKSGKAANKHLLWIQSNLEYSEQVYTSGITNEWETTNYCQKVKDTLQ